MLGAKIARLGELLDVGVPVPQGFAVTSDAYRRHCQESGLDRLIDDAMKRRSSADILQKANSVSKEVRTLLESTPMSREMSEEIVSAYEDLCLQRVDVSLPVAVRSSAFGEDSATASFAGIYDSYLGVTGGARVLHAIRRCWGSLFTPRAIAYRLERGLPHVDAAMAVGVLELIRARSSGVAFSAHPASGKRDRVVIEGCWGWGEAVVQGQVTPDRIEVGKADGRLLRYEVAEKEVMSTFDVGTGKFIQSAVPTTLRDRAVLENHEIAAVADTVNRIEQHYQHAIDVEWVLEQCCCNQAHVCVVQARPVTFGASGAEQDKSKVTTWNPGFYAAKYVRNGGL